MKDVALLGAPTARTRAYLTALREAGLAPAKVLLVTAPGKAAPADLVDLARDAGSAVVAIEARDVNDRAVAEALRACALPYVVFSGPAGAIVRASLFDTGCRFIHVHPGRLPDFRGSTTIYYSLLAENTVEASALFLDPVIDAGPVIGHMTFASPQDRREIDAGYDPQIRAQLLVSVLKGYKQRGYFETISQTGSGETYYIIHPVLKHLAILGT